MDSLITEPSVPSFIEMCDSLEAELNELIKDDPTYENQASDLTINRTPYRHQVIKIKNVNTVINEAVSYVTPKTAQRILSKPVRIPTDITQDS